jgi:hypothetical protein
MTVALPVVGAPPLRWTHVLGFGGAGVFVPRMALPFSVRPFNERKLGGVTGAGVAAAVALGTAGGAAPSGKPSVVGTLVVDGTVLVIGAAVVFGTVLVGVACGAVAVRRAFGDELGAGVEPRSPLKIVWPVARDVVSSATAPIKKTHQAGRAAHRSGVIVGSSMNGSISRRNPSAGSKVAGV